MTILWVCFKSKTKSGTLAIMTDTQCFFFHLRKWINKEFEFLICINFIGFGRELVVLFYTFKIVLVRRN